MKLPVILSTISLSILLSSCFAGYFKINSSDNNVNTVTQLDSLVNKGKNFILHNASKTYKLTDVKVDRANNTVTATAATANASNMHYIPGMKRSGMKYKKDEEAETLKEVHLHVKKELSLASGNFNVHVNEIERVEIVEDDVPRYTRRILLMILIPIVAYGIDLYIRYGL